MVVIRGVVISRTMFIPVMGVAVLGDCGFGTLSFRISAWSVRFGQNNRNGGEQQTQNGHAKRTPACPCVLSINRLFGSLDHRPHSVFLFFALVVASVQNVNPF